MCETLTLDEGTHALRAAGLSVVNGCQSLTTIMAYSEKARAAKDAYILFRIYEIPQREVADRISMYTNWQNAVKPRDLRPNDKRVLSLKRAFETAYPDAYMITKRGEERPADRNAVRTLDIALLAKLLMTWHGQRPNMAYNENRLFDKHFELLFRPDYPPANIVALYSWWRHIEKRWDQQDLGLPEELVALPSYSKLHLLFAIQACFNSASGQPNKVPEPAVTERPVEKVGPIITLAANCYKAALNMALTETQGRERIFNPQNWLKNKDSVLKIQAAASMYMGMVPSMPGGTELQSALVLQPNQFSLRWSAD